jgi:hypothetical protein
MKIVLTSEQPGASLARLSMRTMSVSIPRFKDMQTEAPSCSFFFFILPPRKPAISTDRRGRPYVEEKEEKKTRR